MRYIRKTFPRMRSNIFASHCIFIRNARRVDARARAKRENECKNRWDETRGRIGVKVGMGKGPVSIKFRSGTGV